MSSTDVNGRSLSIGDVSLWVQEAGPTDGDAILLVAGANASGLMWPDNLVNLLAAKGFRVIRYDHRDTGRSTHRPFDDYPYSVEDLASDALGVLNGLGIERAHVVGLSMGGTIGQVLALDHPERLASLTLMLTAALDVDFASNYERAMSGEVLADGLPTPRPDVVAQLRRMFTPGRTLEEEVQRRVEQWRMLAGRVLPFPEEEFRQQELAAIEHAGSFIPPTSHARARPVPTTRGAELPRLTTPTLVIQGTEDPLNPPPHGAHLAALIPCATLAEICGMGHALPRAVHQEISQLIIRHARRHPPPNTRE